MLCDFLYASAERFGSDKQGHLRAEHNALALTSGGTRAIRAAVVTAVLRVRGFNVHLEYGQVVVSVRGRLGSCSRPLACALETQTPPGPRM